MNKDHKHGLTKDEQEELSLLRACANASPFHPQQGQTATKSEAEQGEIDGLYSQAVTDLKSSDVWKNHDSVQHYYWLCIPKVITL